MIEKMVERIIVERKNDKDFAREKSDRELRS